MHDPSFHLARHPHPAIRRQAIWRLAESEEPESLGCLFQLATDPVGGVRAAALSTLSQWDLSSTHEVLRRAIGDADPRVRRVAVAGMHSYESAENLAAMQTVLRTDPVHYVRRAVLECLDGWDGSRTIAALAQALLDPDWSVRIRAENMIASSVDRELYDAVAPQVRASNELTRWRAAFALRRWRTEEVRASLLEAACASQWHYRIKAVKCLAHTPDAAVAVVLMKLAETDPVVGVQIAAVRAMENCLSDSVRVFLKKLCCDGESRVSRIAALVLASDHSDETLDWVVSRLQAPESATQRNVQIALGDCQGYSIDQKTLGRLQQISMEGLGEFCRLCTEGDLETAEWMLKYKRCLPRAEFQSQMEAAFWSACQARRIHVIRWLVKEAPELWERLDAELSSICRTGDWPLAMYIVDYVDTEALIDIFAPSRQLLRYAFHQDAMWAVDWLLGLQGRYGPAQWGVWVNGIFTDACAVGRLWMVELLLSLPEARQWIDPAARGQAAFARAAVTSWPVADSLLRHDENPPMIQFARVYHALFEQACTHRDEGMIRWLLKNAESGGGVMGIAGEGWVDAEMQAGETIRPPDFPPGGQRWLAYGSSAWKEAFDGACKNRNNARLRHLLR